MIDIKKIRESFSFFKNNKDTIYLDSAASSLKLDKAIEKQNFYYNNLSANVFRGAYKLSYLATKEYENARQQVANFLNSDFEEIVFTKGTTQSLNLIANSAINFLTSKDNIITSQLEHNSSYLPWYNQSKNIGFEIRFVELVNNRITLEQIKKQVDQNTKVIVLTYVSNTTGYITPIKEITEFAHENNIIVVLDCAQAAPHIKIDVKDLDIDFLAFSSHKMYGPTGLGILYGKYDKLKLLNSYEYGGEMVSIVSKDEVIYKTPPYNLEAGTPPIAQAIGFIESLNFINQVGLNNISKYEYDLTKYAFDKLKDIKGVNLVNDSIDTGIISFNIEDIHPHDIASGYDQYNICLRAGLHCAGLFMEKNNLSQGTLRISISFYNTKEEIDKFISATKEIIKFFKEVTI